LYDRAVRGRGHLPGGGLHLSNYDYYYDYYYDDYDYDYDYYRTDGRMRRWQCRYR
jgi:hypothetical protein